MDVECIAPFNILCSVYPEISIGYKPINKHIELKIKDKFELALLIKEEEDQLKPLKLAGIKK